MTGHTFRGRRLLVAVLAVSLFVVFNEGTLVTPVAASAVMLPDCENECGPGADCASGCKIQIGEFLDEITCGDYNGGAANNQCNTCNAECNIWSNPNQACWMGGSQSDCETDGPEYAICGDDICQNGTGGEGCDTCVLDCGECPDIVCGDDLCDPGETYVTCPEDCDDPGETGVCGDGICSEDDEETPETCDKDCITPNERCEDDFDCGPGYQCAPGGEPFGGQCINTDYLDLLEPCDPESPSCTGVGYECRQAENAYWPGGYIYVCIYWYDL